MKITQRLLGIALAMFISFFCKAIEVKSFDIKNFTGIQSSIVADINIEISNEYSVEISTSDQKGVSNIEVYIDRNNRLCFDYIKEYHYKKDSKKTIIHITTPKLTQIELNGVGDITTTTPFDAVNLSLVLGGVGTINFEGDGNIQNLDIVNTGVGHINAKQIECNDGKVNLTGVGSISINAKNTLKGQNSGVGNLIIYGDAYIDIKNSGVGKIIRK